MDLDRHKLAEERVWRRQNYEQQVQRLVSSLVDAIQLEAKRALEREIAYGDDMRDEYSYVRQAGQLQHAILQAVNNADFGGLTRDAGELHAVEMALHSLAKMKAQLPAAMVEQLERSEDERQLALYQGKVEDREQRDRAAAAQCRAAVSHSGRGAGFSQCQRRGKLSFVVDNRPGHLGRKPVGDVDTIEVLLCGTHAKDAERGRVHVWTPNDWEKGMIEKGERKHRAELDRLRESLPAQLTAGAGGE